MKRARFVLLMVGCGVLFAGAGTSGQLLAQVPLDYNFPVNQTYSTLTIDFSLYDGEGTGGTLVDTDSNWAYLTGTVDATLWQTGPGLTQFTQIQLNAMDVSATSNLSLTLNAGSLRANATATGVSLTDNAVPGTGPVDGAGNFAIPGYQVNTYGTVDYDVEMWVDLLIGGFWMDVSSGNMNLSDNNPQAGNVTGTVVKSGADVLLTANQSVSGWEYDSGYTLAYDITLHMEGQAPFQTPEPASVVLTFGALAALIARRRKRR